MLSYLSCVAFSKADKQIAENKSKYKKKKKDQKKKKENNQYFQDFSTDQSKKPNK
jgi:hypothetical protein